MELVSPTGAAWCGAPAALTMLRAGAAAREAHGISEGMFYKMKKQGITPREMKVGTRTLIAFEAAADWQREREAASVAEPGPRPRRRSGTL